MLCLFHQQYQQQQQLQLHLSLSLSSSSRQARKPFIFIRPTIILSVLRLYFLGFRCLSISGTPKTCHLLASYRYIQNAQVVVLSANSAAAVAQSLIVNLFTLTSVCCCSHLYHQPPPPHRNFPCQSSQYFFFCFTSQLSYQGHPQKICIYTLSSASSVCKPPALSLTLIFILPRKQIKWKETDKHTSRVISISPNYFSQAKNNKLGFVLLLLLICMLFRVLVFNSTFSFFSPERQKLSLVQQANSLHNHPRTSSTLLLSCC